MAAFRAITAEEEAATALIISVKRKKYPNADRLNARNHDHKSSIFFLIQVISGILAKVGHTPRVYLVDKDGPPRFYIEMDIQKLAGNEFIEPHFIQPVLPLDFTISDDSGTKTFASEFAEFASERGYVRARDYLKAQANLRNRILYAADNGIPKIEIPDEFILHRKERIAAILSIVIMIEQTQDVQSFAVQSLHALLQILEKLENNVPPPIKARPPQEVCLKIERTPHASRIGVVKDGKTSTALFEYATSTEFDMTWFDTWTIKGLF